MTLDETADFISQGLPEYQRTANLAYITQIHKTLKVGGTWGYPNTGQVFTSTEDGFMLDFDPVSVEQ